MTILGIETSCDETSASILRTKRSRLKLLSHITASQISTHSKYGGVVPEVAAREHVTSIIPTVDQALKQAKIIPKKISAIAVTAGPGLVTSLRVGVQTAKTLAYAWNKKIIRINHIEGHIYANWYKNPSIKLPALCLVVSGGHTELIYIKKHGCYSLIGRTRDDAAGEAFDKVAKLLNLGYPGGPKIQALASQGNPWAFDFPRPMLDQNNYDFSFSGLKTSVLYLLKKEFKNKKIPAADICASFQRATVDVLVAKTAAAAENLGTKNVLLAGGVAANQLLRQRLKKELTKLSLKTKLFFPSRNLCTDNAAMVAIAGLFNARRGKFIDWQRLQADPNWELI